MVFYWVDCSRFCIRAVPQLPVLPRIGYVAVALLSVSSLGLTEKY